MYADQQTGFGANKIVGQSDQSKQIPELPGQMSRLERAIAYAEENFNQLAARLEGASTRPQGPSATEKSLTVASPASGYASTVYGYTERVDTLSKNIVDLLQRLEV